MTEAIILKIGIISNLPEKKISKNIKRDKYESKKYEYVIVFNN